MAMPSIMPSIIIRHFIEAVAEMPEAKYFCYQSAYELAPAWRWDDAMNLRDAQKMIMISTINASSLIHEAAYAGR